MKAVKSQLHQQILQFDRLSYLYENPVGANSTIQSLNSKEKQKRVKEIA